MDQSKGKRAVKAERNAKVSIDRNGTVAISLGVMFENDEGEKSEEVADVTCDVEQAVELYLGLQKVLVKARAITATGRPTLLPAKTGARRATREARTAKLRDKRRK